MQFAYRANGSTEDAGNMALQYVLEHLDTAGNYTRLLFVDFSSADPSWSTSFLDFLTNRSQRVKLGKIIPSTRSTSTGSPQSCVLSPLLFSLYTNNSVSLYPSVKLLKFADDTTLVGLISRYDELAYRWEIEWLRSWCGNNDLELSPLKTVDGVLPEKRSPSPSHHAECYASGIRALCPLFGLSYHNLKWELSTTALLKKAQKRLFFLRQLKKFRRSRTVMAQFYMAIIESILTHSIIT